MPIRPCLHDGVHAIELSTSALRLVAVHGFGPRLAWFGPAGGGNLLLWDDVRHPRFVRKDGLKPWNLRGGHRLWTCNGPADESEETYVNDDAPGTGSIETNACVVTGAFDPQTRTRRSMHIAILGERHLRIEHRLVNEGNMLYACGLWALSCTVPTPQTRYLVPLGDGSSWDTATITVFRAWAGHGTGSFREEQFALEDDAYVLTPRGRETKRMLRTPRGLIAMSVPEHNLTLAIHSPFQPNATYPVGANLAFYVGPNNFMVEMETMGPLATLRPGETVAHVEDWHLLPQAIAPTGAALLAALR